MPSSHDQHRVPLGEHHHFTAALAVQAHGLLHSPTAFHVPLAPSTVGHRLPQWVTAYHSESPPSIVGHCGSSSYPNLMSGDEAPEAVAKCDKSCHAAFVNGTRRRNPRMTDHAINKGPMIFHSGDVKLARSVRDEFLPILRCSRWACLDKRRAQGNTTMEICRGDALLTAKIDTNNVRSESAAAAEQLPARSGLEQHVEKKRRRGQDVPAAGLCEQSSDVNNGRTGSKHVARDHHATGAASANLFPAPWPVLTTRIEPDEATNRHVLF
ncbi:hypothetical protein DCS_08181 [Drechmeria coniospora]|uniref:Uncharacterized protein n=1 Tax=Drechmeria coniospora TaxID=98403 RepID=A0A151GGI2_DRECN|nr:hypothetical protein DCS_08181 [Drechmeria coniospora]KYK56213.1 hypothetical protein DCS_08181 [Drechmeria coniospora]